MTVPDSRRVLTVRQPWADLIMAGVKTVENRTRPVPSTLPQWTRCTGCDRRDPPGALRPGGRRDLSIHHHRTVWTSRIVDAGPFPFLLWIHAATYRARDTSPGIAEAWCSLAEAWGLDPAAYGYRIGALAIQRARDEGRYGAVLGPVTVVGQHHADGCWHPVHTSTCQRIAYHDHEFRHCSPWAEPDRWHIEVTDPQPLDTPIPMRGQQGWWRLPDDVEGG